MATAAMVLLIFYSGLHFKGASIANQVAWLGLRPGIRFGKYGIAFTAPTRAATVNPAADPGPLSIEMALKSGPSSDGHFRFLLLLHDGHDDTQLVIGQWKSWLIVMNGDDYDAKRRRARIAVRAFQQSRERFVTVASGPAGTSVFLDGRLARSKADLHLQIPNTGGGARLVLGNSIYGRHPWMGEIFGLAFFDRVLAGPTVEAHFRQWDQARSLAFAVQENSTGLYLFDEGGGAKVVDHGKGGKALRIPAKMTILTKEFLTAPFAHGEYNPSLFQDMVINIAGFVPMGFLLSALLCHGRRRDFRKRLLIVMLACGAMSLVIEVAQAWIPSRSSQMLDLILNTLGAGVGVALHDLYRRAFPAVRPGRPPQG
jgi:VanZ family protein